MKKTILVTGAAGFIGSFLCEELLLAGYKVIGVDNFFRGTHANLDRLCHSDFESEALDLSDENTVGPLQNILKQHQIEVVIHLAAINGTQYFYDNPLFVFEKNIQMTQHVLAAISNTTVQYIIYASSSEVYGNPLTIPTKEDHPILLNALADRDSYAASKAFGDFYVRLFAQKNHKSVLILRIFNMYGERMVGTKYGQVVPEFVNRLLHETEFTIIGDGTQTRSFCYIQDATTIILTLMEQRVTGFVNVGNDDEISILKLAELLHSLEQKPFNPIFLPKRPNDHQRRRPDIRYLKTLIPSIVFTPLATGLQKVVEYYRKSKL